MLKTAVYSWRLSPDLKDALEGVAHDQRTSMAALLERIAREWLARSRSGDRDDNAAQQRRHAAAAQCLGMLESGDPDRATQAKERLREKLARAHGRPG